LREEPDAEKMRFRKRRRNVLRASDIVAEAIPKTSGRNAEEKVSSQNVKLVGLAAVFAPLRHRAF